MWWQISCCSRHASAESRAEGLEEELKAACDDVVQAHATKASLSRLRFSLVGMAVLMLLAASGAVGYGVYFLRMRHFWQWTPFSRVAQAMFAVLALIVVGIYVIAWRMNAAEARGVAAARAKTDLLQQAANELPYKTARKVIEKYDPANVGKYLELDLTLEKQVADLRGACRELFGVIDVLLQQRSTTVTSEQFRAEVAPVQQVLNKYARYFSSRTRRLLTAGIDERVMDFLGVTPMPATATPAAHTAHATANRTPRTGAPQSSPVPEVPESQGSPGGTGTTEDMPSPAPGADPAPAVEAGDSSLPESEPERRGARRRLAVDSGSSADQDHR